MVFFSSCKSVKFHSELLNYIDIPVMDIYVSRCVCPEIPEMSPSPCIVAPLYCGHFEETPPPELRATPL